MGGFDKFADSFSIGISNSAANDLIDMTPVFSVTKKDALQSLVVTVNEHLMLSPS